MIFGLLAGFQERRQPRNFQIQSHRDENIGAIELGDETRFDRHRVHELDAAGEALDVH